MIRRFVLLIPAALCLTFALSSGSLAAAEIAGPHGRLALISQDRSIAPGRAFWVGLHFKLEPHWHIYWKNPGDSGEPPSVRWKLPQGVTAGPIEWPAPQRIESFTLVDYGYEGNVLLPVLLHAGPGLAPGSTVRLSARINWLICYDTCIPAAGELSLSLPVRRDRPQPDPEVMSLFKKVRASLPQRLPLSWKAAALSEPKAFLLSIHSALPETGAVFFPLETGQIKDAAPQKITIRGQTIEIRLVKSDQLMKPLKVLNGVVVFPSGPPRVIHAQVESLH